MIFIQAPRKQHWQSYLIKLKTSPISLPVNPTVLRKTTVGSLHGGEPAQGAQRRAHLASSNTGGCAMHQIARPHAVITAHVSIAFRFAPRNAHRSDERALKYLIFMRE